MFNVISDEEHDSIELLVQANNKIEWMWTLYFKYFLIASGFSVILMTIASVFLCWLLNENCNTIHFYHPAYFMYGHLD